MNRNILIFGIFLILSFLFWYLNSLGKTIETEVRYPVVFPDYPENGNKALNLPSKITLTMAGKGYTILQHKVSSARQPLNVPSSFIRQDNRSDKANFYIITSDLLNTFNSQIKSECRVTAIKPDTLWLGTGASGINH